MKSKKKIKWGLWKGQILTHSDWKNKLNVSIAERKLQILSTVECFHLPSSTLLSNLVILRVLCPTFVSGIFKNTEGNFSSTHYPCWQRRKPLGTGIFCLFGIVVSLNSIGVSKCRGQLHSTLGLGIPIHPSLLGSDISLSQLLYREILPSSHLSSTRHDLWSLGMPIVS